MIGYEHFRVERHEDTMVVQFLDRRVVAELAITDVGEELYAVASRPDCRKLVLNFCAVEFLSSADARQAGHRKEDDRGQRRPFHPL